MRIATRSEAPLRARRPSASPVALVGANVQMRLNGHLVTALPEGALWLHGIDALVVSDLHLEKGSAFASRGRSMLPPYDTRAALLKLAGLIASLSPRVVVSLGDSFHDVGGPARMDEDDRALLMALTAQCDWIWNLGNHDPQVPAYLGGRMLDEVRVEALTLRHEPSAEADAGEIAGHLHPCARVSGRGTSVRRRCFAFDGERLVMPAFGAFTGGLNVRDEAFAPLFPDGLTALVLANKRVLPAAYDRLVGDV